MNANEHISHVALASYESYKADPTDYSKLHGAIVNFNGIPERIAHEVLAYAGKLTRGDVDVEEGAGTVPRTKSDQRCR